ncbi:MAG: CYTH domain-containing protein [Treponema sp.]|jgi:adenylate cyclase class 2|nr:CYTH domain-containing protein [Treponema sp.]
MYEIELKAHVTDKSETIRKLNSFAQYVGFTDKADRYWTLDKPDAPNQHITVRIRTEIHNPESDNETKNVVLTYKRKEIIKKNGTVCEVNDEKECTLSKSDPVKSLLQDTGFYVSLKKHKLVDAWTFATPAGKALLELCTVPPLGDFLEIEILSAANDSASVEAAREQLEILLGRCGLPKSAVEPRYYRDLLHDAESL